MKFLPAAGLILTGLMASGLLELFPPLVGFSLAFLLVTWVTGETLRTQLRISAPLSHAVIGFLLGLALNATILWLCGLLGATLSGSVLVLAAVLALFFGAALVRNRNRAGQRGVSGNPVLVGCLAVLVSAMLIVSPPPTSPRGDGYDHIGYVRTMIVENDLQPAGVLAPVAGETPAADPRKGAFHSVFALVCRSSGVDPAVAWRWLPAFLAPLAILSFWSFCRMILPGGHYATAAMILFVMFQGGLATDFLSTIAYGQHLALVFYWTLVVLGVTYGRRADRRMFFTITLITLGGGLVHIDVVIHAVLSVMGLVLFHRVFDMSTRGAWILAAATGAATAVVVIWKAAGSYAPGNLMHLHPQGLLYLTERLFVPSPVELLKRYGLLFVGGLALSPGLLLIRRHRQEARMCIALSLPALFIVLNPWLVGVVYERAGYLVSRFLLNVPVFAITVLTLGTLIQWARRSRWPARVAAAVVLFAWGRLFMMSTGAWAADLRSEETATVDSGRTALAAYVNRNLEPGSTVLSDPMTSYWLSAHTHAKVVTLLHQHATPSDPHAFERLNDVRKALSPYSSQLDAIATVRKYAVDYVLLNGAGRPVLDYLADWYPETVPVVAKKIGALEETFDLIYEENGYLLYRVSPRDPQHATWSPNVPFVIPAPESAVRCPPAPATPYGAPRVTALRIQPARVLPREQVRITITYQRDRDVKSPMPLLLHIRLDDVEYFSRVREFPGDKIVRRYRERVHGWFHRIRLDHRPFGGMYPPHMWPLGVEVTEALTVQLPPGLREATYEVQVRLTHEPLVPNFSIRDLIYNDDGYGGVPCGTLIVTRQVVR